ncbi:MAG: hypothetical protein JWO22_4064 [Frankiales bacterium]|nr:hypothetical protein [Frankiales bacterium]
MTAPSAGTVEMTIRFPYKRSLGPVIGAFMTGLAGQQILGIRNGSEVMCPPLEWDPKTGKELDHGALVEVGPAGTVVSWTWVPKPSAQHPLDKPFALALIRLDGADTALTHAVDAGSIDAMSTGMRVAPRWKAERQGHITDIEAFVPGEDPQGLDDSRPEEPVTMMPYNAEIPYTLPIAVNTARNAVALKEKRLIGLRCPVCSRTYAGERGFCPIDTTALTAEHEVQLPQTGTLTNYTIITPVQYPGQTETEPFARCMILVDDSDLVIGYQPVIDLPVEQVRVGVRVKLVWGDGDIEGWQPTGEPDVDDPDLVNRIY